MSKKGTEPTVKPAIPLDPAWRSKFKSTKELDINKKRSNRKNSSGKSE